MSRRSITIDNLSVNELAAFKAQVKASPKSANEAALDILRLGLAAGKVAGALKGTVADKRETMDACPELPEVDFGCCDFEPLE